MFSLIYNKVDQIFTSTFSSKIKKIYDYNDVYLSFAHSRLYHMGRTTVIYSSRAGE